MSYYFFFILLGDSTPSPNSYSLPALLGSKIPNRYSSASFSMTGRAKTGGFAEDLAKTPGPGNYRTVDPVVYKKRDPAYSMNQRSYMPGGKYLKCNRYHLLQLFKITSLQLISNMNFNFTIVFFWKRLKHSQSTCNLRREQLVLHCCSCLQHLTDHLSRKKQ